MRVALSVDWEYGGVARWSKLKRVAVVAVGSSPRCVATRARTISCNARAGDAVLAGDGLAAGWSKVKRVAVVAVASNPRGVAALAGAIASDARVGNAVLAGDGVAAGWSKVERVADVAVRSPPRCITFACVAVVGANHVSTIFGANRIENVHQCRYSFLAIVERIPFQIIVIISTITSILTAIRI